MSYVNFLKQSLEDLNVLEVDTVSGKNTKIVNLGYGEKDVGKYVIGILKEIPEEEQRVEKIVDETHKALESMTNAMNLMGFIMSNKALESNSPYLTLALKEFGIQQVSTEGILGDLWDKVKGFFKRIGDWFKAIAEEMRTGEKKFKARAAKVLERLQNISDDSKQRFEKEAWQTVANKNKKNNWLVFDESGKLIDTPKYVDTIVQYGKDSFKAIEPMFKEYLTRLEKPENFGKLAERLKNLENEIKKYHKELKIPNVTLDDKSFTFFLGQQKWIQEKKRSYHPHVGLKDSVDWINTNVKSYSKYVGHFEALTSMAYDLAKLFNEYQFDSVDHVTTNTNIWTGQQYNTIQKADEFAKKLKPLFYHAGHHLDMTIDLLKMSYKHMRATLSVMEDAISAAK